MPLSKRLFLGLELPESCKAILASLDPCVKGLRWIEPSQLHLTLSFLGDVEDWKEEKLKEELQSVYVPVFILPLKGVGSFGSRERPSVIWVGVGKGHPHLFALHHHLQDAVLRAGLEPDLKPFHPHVTVGRTKTVTRQRLLPFFRAHTDEEFGMFKVTGFTLFSSVLDPQGSAYHVEMRCFLDPEIKHLPQSKGIDQ